MLKYILRIPVYFFCLIAFNTCTDPYTPHMGKYKSVLVVEGLITDEKIPYEVTLSRTFQSIDSVTAKVSDAVVFITDESGNATNLNYSGEGTYKTDSSLFRGEAGKTYTLHIQTSNGNKYESEPCLMAPVTDINSVYYAKEENISSTSGKTLTGIEIYLDSKDNSGDNRYFRWKYEETWKFKLPSPKRYNYVSDTEIIPLTDIREYCWKSSKSAEILIGSILQGQADFIQKEPVLFIQSDLSDRLTIRYSILVKQMSISGKEYDFWNNLKQVNEAGGTIFDSQPYSVISNIYNVDDQDETVLGYFSVSAVKEKRIYINPGDLIVMNMPHYNYDCEEFVVSPSDYNSTLPPGAKPMNFDDVYNMFVSAGNIVFVGPIYNAQNKLYKLVFATTKCSDCGLSGEVDKPDFWADL
jgi:hypothetical protein